MQVYYYVCMFWKGEIFIYIKWNININLILHIWTGVGESDLNISVTYLVKKWLMNAWPGSHRSFHVPGKNATFMVALNEYSCYPPIVLLLSNTGFIGRAWDIPELALAFCKEVVRGILHILLKDGWFGTLVLRGVNIFFA